MTQENKELLLRDLCGRLSYGVKILTNNNVESLQGISILDNVVEYGSFLSCDIEEVKPYLRSMSNMTNEEKKGYEKVCELDTEILANHSMNGEPFPALYNSQDWLNKNMFDYRSLIEKGLAIEVTEENNPYKD